MVRHAISGAETVTSLYQAFKCSYCPAGETVSTEALCTQQGLNFIPMVIESHAGGWGSAARQTLAFISKSIAASLNENPELASLWLAQRLSISLHRETARAILKRCCEEAVPAAPDELVGATIPPW